MTNEAIVANNHYQSPTKIITKNTIYKNNTNLGDCDLESITGNSIRFDQSGQGTLSSHRDYDEKKEPPVLMNGMIIHQNTTYDTPHRNLSSKSSIVLPQYDTTTHQQRQQQDDPSRNDSSNEPINSSSIVSPSNILEKAPTKGRRRNTLYEDYRNSFRAVNGSSQTTTNSLTDVTSPKTTTTTSSSGPAPTTKQGQEALRNAYSLRLDGPSSKTIMNMNVNNQTSAAAAAYGILYDENGQRKTTKQEQRRRQNQPLPPMVDQSEELRMMKNSYQKDQSVVEDWLEQSGDSSNRQLQASQNRHAFIQKRLMATKLRAKEVAEKQKKNRGSQCSSNFFKDGQRRIDFALVFESRADSESELRDAKLRRQDFENQLISEGLELEYDWPEPDDPLCLGCVKVHAPWELLCRSAEMLQMRLPLRRHDMAEEPPGKFSEWMSGLFQLTESERALLPDCPAYVTAPFDLSRIDQFLIEDYYHPDSFFTPIQRIRIVWDCLQRCIVNDIQTIIQNASTSSNLNSTETDSIHEKTEISYPSSHADGPNKTKRGIQWLLKDKVYNAVFPLHDGEAEPPKKSPVDKGTTGREEKWCERQVLRHLWARFGHMIKYQPLDAIRRYYGEHVAFYFAWLGFYSQMLIFPSVAGIICFLTSLFMAGSSAIVQETCDTENIPGNITMCPVCTPPNCDVWSLSDSCTATWWAVVFDNISTVCMAVFTVLWASIFQELWKRKEVSLAFRWDAVENEKVEDDIRPEFEARTQWFHINPVTKEQEPYVPFTRKLLLVGGSVSALLFLILCVVTALFALVVVRIALYGLFKAMGGVFQDARMDLASWAINGLTFAVVIALGWFYSHAAHRLTELETPRTQGDYLSSYIWKVFIFEILNNFIPIFYVAFMKGRSLGKPSEQNYLLEMCDPSGCLNEVVATVAILLLFRLVVSNAAELGVPMLKTLFNRSRHGNSDSKSDIATIFRWREDYQLNEPELDGVYAEYLEMMVQFGFVTLFVPAFPLLPFICLLNNVVEVRLDAVNFVTSYRRPLPMRVSGIKIWYSCLNIITKLAVLCNAGIIAFTSDLIPLWVYQYVGKSGDEITERGYALFRLARFNTSDWVPAGKYLIESNITECYYPGFNEPTSPYEPTLMYWKIMTFRLLCFLAFSITFYYFQWLADFLIPDVPQDVQMRSDRASYLAKKTLYLNQSTRATSRMSNAFLPGGGMSSGGGGQFNNSNHNIPSQRRRGSAMPKQAHINEEIVHGERRKRAESMATIQLER